MPHDGGFSVIDAPIAETWGVPDMSVTGTNRRLPPALPLDKFGKPWADWIGTAADSAASPPDYVALPLLATASALIGNARWAQGGPGWCEPPHLWCGVVGDSGSSKSPGSDCIFGAVLPELERRMQGDFPDRLRAWKAVAEVAAANDECWKSDVRKARKDGSPPPPPPAHEVPPEPQAPRLRQTDVTIEKVATLLATAASKGLLIVRDELAGWFLGMKNYNDSGREFWIEAFGGRFYRVERQKHPQPIDVPHLAVGVTGGTQPDKLADLLRSPDDGLLARMLWAWPESLPFRLGRANPSVMFAIDALDRLRLLEMEPASDAGASARPTNVPLAITASTMVETFGREMQMRQQSADGLMRSAYGKARGVALRLSLVIECLWWCAAPGGASPPVEISEHALAAACSLVADYFMPMAERVYGDAATPMADRKAATLAKWIIRSKAREVHVRYVQREVRLPGLPDSHSIRAAADLLVDADWLRPPPKGGQSDRARIAYAVNPALA
jgi:hypothetical protein